MSRSFPPFLRPGKVVPGGKKPAQRHMEPIEPEKVTQRAENKRFFMKIKPHLQNRSTLVIIYDTRLDAQFHVRHVRASRSSCKIRQDFLPEDRWRLSSQTAPNRLPSPALPEPGRRHLRGRQAPGVPPEPAEAPPPRPSAGPRQPDGDGKSAPARCLWSWWCFCLWWSACLSAWRPM